MAEDVVVISLGGSLVNPGEPDVAFIRSFASLLKDLPYRYGVVVGGGSYARVYANALRQLGGSEFEADYIGIEETWQNALLIATALKPLAYPKVVKDFRDAPLVLKNFRAVVMGGTIPGITTDTDAVLLAEAVGAVRLINVSRVGAIYDRPPSEEGAKPFRELTTQQLMELALKYDTRAAGSHFIFDLVACKLSLRLSLELHFVSGKVEEIGKAIRGEPHSGTVVRPA